MSAHTSQLSSGIGCNLISLSLLEHSYGKRGGGEAPLFPSPRLLSVSHGWPNLASQTLGSIG